MHPYVSGGQALRSETGDTDGVGIGHSSSHEARMLQWPAGVLQDSANVPTEAASYGLASWVPATPVREADGTLGSWLQLQPVSGFVDIEEVNPFIDGLLSVHLCLSAFQKNNFKYMHLLFFLVKLPSQRLD